MTVTSLAPASNESSTRVLITSGLVVAASSGVRSQPMFGLIMTLSPLAMKRFIPPSAASASLVMAAGDSPVIMAISGLGLAWARSEGPHRRTTLPSARSFMKSRLFIFLSFAQRAHVFQYAFVDAQGHLPPVGGALDPFLFLGVA